MGSEVWILKEQVGGQKSKVLMLSQCVPLQPPAGAAAMDEPWQEHETTRREENRKLSLLSHVPLLI